ncbi:Nramp family metal ion transporter [Streptococcus pneumoniae]|nr:Nramp family metal ion transporter [Streptococcus pneumoniae]
MSQAISLNQSTWASKLKAMGPGILMATAAVGGSHIVSSTQAGGSYGWSLLLLVILANVFKYPFFRFGAEYTADTGKTLVEGYAEKGKLYLWIFFILNVFSAMVNTAGVAILCSAIIASAFPMIGLSITQWSLILVAIIWAMLLFGGYKLLDGMVNWLKVMPKKENSISGFSLFSMSFRLWSTRLVLPFCAQLSSPVPSQ